ncbi:uncharacterized protein [Pseudorasbora parva]|uniref:uncharacterized protein isoform X2 n=1 Tax=Pseudorasbora parva TaxID=51549 RepID=UPI00351E4F57
MMIASRDWTTGASAASINLFIFKVNGNYLGFHSWREDDDFDQSKMVNKDVLPSVEPEIGSIKSAAAIVHADSVETELTTVTTADSQPADTAPKTHFTGTDMSRDMFQTCSNMPVSDDNLQSERSKLGPESHPVTPPAEDSVIPSPTDTQVWSEIDHASPSTSECVPPLERTESVFVAFQNHMDTDSSSAEDGNVSHSNPKLGPESHPVTPPAEDSVIPSPTDTQVAFQNHMDTDSRRS